MPYRSSNRSGRRSSVAGAAAATKRALIESGHSAYDAHRMVGQMLEARPRGRSGGYGRSGRSGGYGRSGGRWSR